MSSGKREHLDNEHFIVELAKLFTKSRVSTSGSVVISMKRYDGRTKPVPRKQDKLSISSEPLSCLFRAKCGNKTISTQVHPKDVNKFQLVYAGVLKNNIDSLKKRDKKTTKKINQ